MPRPVVLLPDPTLALLQYLRTVPMVTAVVPASRILTRLPTSPVYPTLIVQRIGGNALLAMRIDEPSMQVDAVGADEATCSLVIRSACAAILAIANDTVAEGVLVSAYEQVGPQWLPDTLTTPPLSRFVARFGLFITPR